jgi:hypothetical protein
MDYIMTYPGQFVGRTITKAMKLHLRESIGVAWVRDGMARSRLAELARPLWFLANAYWFSVLILALAGGAIVVRPLGWRGLFHIAFLMWAYVTAVHAVIVADDRYHIPAVPFIAMFAAVAIVRYLEMGHIQKLFSSSQGKE